MVTAIAIIAAKIIIAMNFLLPISTGFRFTVIHTKNKKQKKTSVLSNFLGSSTLSPYKNVNSHETKLYFCATQLRESRRRFYSYKKNGREVSNPKENLMYLCRHRCAVTESMALKSSLSSLCMVFNNPMLTKYGHGNRSRYQESCKGIGMESLPLTLPLKYYSTRNRNVSPIVKKFGDSVTKLRSCSSSSSSLDGYEKGNIQNSEFYPIHSQQLELIIPTAEDMEEFGSILSLDCEAGDVILLGGDIGAGKTCLARGFVRRKTGDDNLRVTSPTYLLSNTYDSFWWDTESEDEDEDFKKEETKEECFRSEKEGEHFKDSEDDEEDWEPNKTVIHHMDLYRLSGNPSDLDPLNLPHVFQECISLIEWPSRLGDLIPNDRLELSFRIDESTDIRIVTITPYGKDWTSRFEQCTDAGSPFQKFMS